MDLTEFTASNFMPKDLIEIICIHERGEKCHSCKIIQKKNYFTVISALGNLFGSIGTWLSSIAYLQKQLCIFILFYVTFFSVITRFLIA